MKVRMGQKRSTWIILLDGLGSVFRWLGLSALLRSMGLHPRHEQRSFELNGKRALIVTTSHSVLHKQDGHRGPHTGVFSSEMTVPYYAFLDSGMQVDLASIQGGLIPVESQSLNPLIRTGADERAIQDADFQRKLNHSLIAEEVDLAAYDVVFFAGGWGAAYDFGQSKGLGKKISETYAGSDTLFGSVCHGALAFVSAVDAKGEPLVKGRSMTGVTQKQLKELRMNFTPLHPEEELRKAGAAFVSNTGWLDILQTMTVVDQEKRFVTGQNQNSGQQTAEKIMELLEQKGR